MAAAARIAQLPLPRLPRIPAWLELHDLGNDRLQLVAGELTYTLPHPLFVSVFKALLPLLDGKHSIDTLLAKGSQQAEHTTVLFVLKSLYARGILYEGDVPLSGAGNERADVENYHDFFGAYAPYPAISAKQVREATICTLATSALSPMLDYSLRVAGFDNISHFSSIDEAEREFGQRFAKGKTAPRLLVAAFESHDRRNFGHINTVCLESGIRWMHVEGKSSQIIVGPTIVPGQTACYACFRGRLGAHLPYRLDVTGEDDFAGLYQGNRGFSAPGPLWSLAFAHVAMECTRLFTGFVPPTSIGRFHEIEATTPTPRSHPVLKLPRCEVCGVRYQPGEDEDHEAFGSR